MSKKKIFRKNRKIHRKRIQKKTLTKKINSVLSRRADHKVLYEGAKETLVVNAGANVILRSSYHDFLPNITNGTFQYNKVGAGIQNVKATVSGQIEVPTGTVGRCHVRLICIMPRLNQDLLAIEGSLNAVYANSGIEINIYNSLSPLDCHVLYDSGVRQLVSAENRLHTNFLMKWNRKKLNYTVADAGQPEDRTPVYVLITSGVANTTYTMRYRRKCSFIDF